MSEKIVAPEARNVDEILEEVEQELPVFQSGFQCSLQMRK